MKTLVQCLLTGAFLVLGACGGGGGGGTAAVPAPVAAAAGQCAVGSVYTAKGCLTQAGCPAGYGWDTVTCVPAAVSGQCATNYQQGYNTQYPNQYANQYPNQYPNQGCVGQTYPTQVYPAPGYNNQGGYYGNGYGYQNAYQNGYQQQYYGQYYRSTTPSYPYGSSYSAGAGFYIGVHAGY